MLLHEGMQQAARLNIDIFVLATSNDSLQLYEKHGFRRLDGLNQSLKPWGVEATYDTYVLIKPAPNKLVLS